MTMLMTLIFFSQGYKRSYDSADDSDSNSVTSENQPLGDNFHTLFCILPTLSCLMLKLISENWYFSMFSPFVTNKCKLTNAFKTIQVWSMAIHILCGRVIESMNLP